MELRRTMLFMPGNNPGMLQTAAVFGSDAVIFDLEDAVALTEKDAARGVKYCIIAGEDEINKGTVVLKDFVNRTQEELSFEKAMEIIKESR